MKKRPDWLCGLLLAILCLPIGVAQGESNWPRWRGPSQDGHYNGPAVPTKWNAGSVVWKAPQKGRGQSSPIIWAERIFLTTASKDGRQRSVFCLNRNDGKLMWEHEVAWSGEPESLHRMNSYATPSCVTDGEVVIAFFGRAGLHCFTVEGKLLWSRDLGAFQSPWGVASCPVLAGDLVIQNCDADTDAYITALDKKTGKPRWRTARPDKRGWSTPILLHVGDHDELVVNGNDGTVAYAPKTGKQLWNYSSGRGRGTPTVTPGKELIYTVCGLGAEMYALRPGGSGNVANSKQVAWTAPRRGGRDLPSPILIGNHLLVSNMSGILTCYDAAAGKVHFKGRISDKTVSSTPIAAAGLAYFQNEAGETLVIKPGDKLNIVSKNTLDAGEDEIFRASLTPSDGQWFSRSNKFLYCIGKRASAPGGN